MKTIADYLDEAKAKTGSDYKTAQRIGLTRAGVSAARKRGILSNQSAAELGRLLDINPGEIVAASEVVAHPEQAKLWERWALTASVMLCVFFIFFLCDQKVSYASAYDNNIHYANLGKMKKMG